MMDKSDIHITIDDGAKGSRKVNIQHQTLVFSSPLSALMFVLLLFEKRRKIVEIIKTYRRKAKRTRNAVTVTITFANGKTLPSTLQPTFKLIGSKIGEILKMVILYKIKCNDVKKNRKTKKEIRMARMVTGTTGVKTGVRTRARTRIMGTSIGAKIRRVVMELIRRILVALALMGELLANTMDRIRKAVIKKESEEVTTATIQLTVPDKMENDDIDKSGLIPYNSTKVDEKNKKMEDFVNRQNGGTTYAEDKKTKNTISKNNEEVMISIIPVVKIGKELQNTGRTSTYAHTSTYLSPEQAEMQKLSSLGGDFDKLLAAENSAELIPGRSKKKRPEKMRKGLEKIEKEEIGIDNYVLMKLEDHKHEHEEDREGSQKRNIEPESLKMLDEFTGSAEFALFQKEKHHREQEEKRKQKDPATPQKGDLSF